MAGDLPSWANKNTAKQTQASGKPSDLPSWAKPSKGGGIPVVGTPKKKSGGGGIGGFFGHLVKQTGTDLYDTAVHSPSGLYQLGKDATVQLKQGFEHPTRSQRNGAFSRDVKGTAKAFAQDLQHPLRHPGNTLLDVAAIASAGAGTAARVAETGRALKAGETAGDVARAALKGPKPEARVIKYNGEEINAGQYSRSALRRQTQKLRDRFQQAFPDARLPETLHTRVGNELKQNRRITDQVEKAPAAALAKVRLKPAEQKAMQVVAEGVPIEKRIKFHEDQLKKFESEPTIGSNTKKIAATKKEITLLRGAQKHVENVGGVPRIVRSNKKLVQATEMARELSQKREALLQGTERLVRDKVNGAKVKRVQALTFEQARGRLVAPAKTMGHSFGLDPEAEKDLFYVPSKAKPAISGIFKPQGFKGGIPKTPGELTHQYTGALLKAGVARNDTSKLISESYLDAHRFATVMKHRDQFLKLAHDTRQGENDIPIRTDALLNKAWPKVIQDISEKPALGKQDLAALENHYEDLRSHLFPDVAAVERELASGAHPNVKWIDKRVLGGLNEPNPSVAGSTRRFTNVFDNINNASRAAILYLKPAYAVPNILGNAALNIVQQGWGAPAQVGRSARLFWNLDKETRNKVKLAMGEGISGSLQADQGIGNKAINAMAHLWQKPVDTPFRMNSFFYEARRAGYKTPAQIKSLFDNENELLKVAREANSAIIDYGNLNPFEQSVIRRVIFFYPWVKGSTRYAGRFLTTHSAQAAFLGQEGKLGSQRDARDLGPLPSYAEGLFKVGDRNGMPVTINPTSAGILQTPAQLGKSALELGSGHPGTAFTFAQNLTPALAAALALVGASQRQKNQSPLGAAEQQLVGGIPALTTLQQLEHPPSESKKPRMYPRNRKDVGLHFLFGGLAPTPLNKAKARAAKYREDHPR